MPFFIIGEKWHDKLILSAMNGAESTTEKLSGAVTSFECDAHNWVSRIWCASHQLDMINQELMRGLLSDSFRSDLVALISTLWHQYKLWDDMGTTCPTISPTRWLSLGTVARWISRHRNEIIRHCTEHNSAPTCSPKLWELLIAVKLFIEPVDVGFKSPQGVMLWFNSKMHILTV